MEFNSKPSTIMHIDLNSCFATIEQQANPFLRGKPVAVAAYTTPSGCIIAPSVEAKKLGIKVGMRVKDGRSIYPDLIILPPDPWKYRNVHLKLRKLLSDYTYDITPKSIDEFVLNLEECPRSIASSTQQACPPIWRVARKIKKRIKREIGDWLTVSIGISTNRFLAKLAAGLHKPDGLDEINKKNFLDCFLKLKLTDLPYIKIQNAARLNSMGIFTVLDFYNAPLWKLKAAFESINGYYWYIRLHGWEIDGIEFGRRSYGNSYALPAGRQDFQNPDDFSPVLSKLVTKMGSRLRRAGYKARGVHLSMLYRDWTHWHKGQTLAGVVFDSRDIYKIAFRIMCQAPYKKPVRELAVSCFGLLKSSQTQLDLFEDIPKKQKLVESIDRVNEHFGDFVITPGRMLYSDKSSVPDRIAFGGVKELEEFTLT